jgi:hypothetical protein
LTEYASADDLLAADPAGPETADIELPTGKVIKVRGMTRYELMLSRKDTEDIAEIERRMLAFCMVEPRMTAKQVEAWQKGSKPMVMAPVIEKIRELSGLGEGAQKSGVDSAGDD